MNYNLKWRKESGKMKIAEHRIESQFLVQAEKCHKQAELAWIEGRTMDMLRFSDDARELMERYYAALDALEPPQDSKKFRIHLPLPILDWSLICIVVFLATYGLILFLNSLQGFHK